MWKAGEKLPSLRTISNENGVSLNTAIQAYYELEKDGFIISRPKSGYIVNYKPIRLSVPATTQPSVKPESKEVVDLIADVYSSLEIGDKSITRFSLGMPEDILLPIAKLNKELIRNMRLRKSIARFTYSWKGNLTEDDIVTTAGVTNAVALALSVITKVGDTIAVESPVYFGMLQLANSMGLRILELPTNPVTGIDPDALKKVLPQFKHAIIRQKNIHLISTPALNQEAVANFMENDRYENHLRKLRQELYANSIHFAHSIMDYFPENTKIVTPQGGFMLWVELDKQIDTTELYYRAMQRKISIAPGRMFTLQEQYTNCMRLSYGQRWTPLLEERLKQLGDIIKNHFN